MEFETGPVVTAEKLRFLFGRVPSAEELAERAHESLLEELLDEDRPEAGTGLSIHELRIAIANRILGEDPTGTWEDVAARLATGADRHAVMDQLTGELAPLIEQVATGLVDVLQKQVHGPVDDIEAAVLARLALDPEDPVALTVLMAAHSEIHDDPESPLLLLPDDVIAYVPALLTGVVLTHHVTAAEHDDQHLDLGVDLLPFARLIDAHVEAGALHVDDGEPRWGGPAGWLPDVPAGALLAVRAGAGAAIVLEPVTDEPAAPAELIAALRAVYDIHHAERGLPVNAEDLLVGMLVRDRTVFAEPRPPLAELAAAAGLECRGLEFVHDPQVWAQAAAFDRAARLSQQLDDELAEVAQNALDMLDEDARDPAVLRRALELLEDSSVVMAVADELLTPDDGSRLETVGELADRLVTAAGSTVRAASAHLLAALVEERAGRPVEAESHLRAAAHAADWPIVDDRLAWYASDRGNALEAHTLWTAAGANETDPSMFVMTPALVAGSATAPGRNDPCWCGSGRKYKQCHRDQPPLPPLADRLAWLEYKPSSYLARRGGAAAEAIATYVDVLAGPDEDPMEVLGDPLLMDVALHEGGWWVTFLAERGVLLPADERELAQSWLACERSIHEVTGIAYGKGVRVRDLRGGDEVAVREPRKVSTGDLLCARIVPDGEGESVFLGEVMLVPRGREGEIRDFLDHGDPLRLLDRLADLESLEA